MIEITWKNPISVLVEPGEYKIMSVLSGIYDILNHSDGDVLINRSGNFTADENSGNYITLPAGMAYNDFALNNCDLYLKAYGSGTVTICRRG